MRDNYKSIGRICFFQSSNSRLKTSHQTLRIKKWLNDFVPNFLHQSFLLKKRLFFLPPETKLEGTVPIQWAVCLLVAMYKLSQHEISFLPWFISNQRFFRHISIAIRGLQLCDASHGNTEPGTDSPFSFLPGLSAFKKVIGPVP